jgi:hypothetical protein
MVRACLIYVLFPMGALAQASFPTDFPAGAQAIESEALRKRLAGNSFNVKPADGGEFRIQYQDTHAYLNLYTSRGTVNDTGTWRVQGSAVCIEWQRVKSGCSEFRLVGDVLYTKRASNGEVVAMQPN